MGELKQKPTDVEASALSERGWRYYPLEGGAIKAFIPINEAGDEVWLRFMPGELRSAITAELRRSPFINERKVLSRLLDWLDLLSAHQPKYVCPKCGATTFEVGQTVRIHVRLDEYGEYIEDADYYEVMDEDDEWMCEECDYKAPREAFKNPKAEAQAE